MKKLSVTLLILLTAAASFAQVGVGTTSPNSTLDVRGSLAINFRAFTTSTTAATTDNMLVFTGTSAATLTLPDATTCTGRVYWAKNASSNTSLLTVATTSSQTIDGIASWSLDEANESVRFVSNGTNWYVSTQGVPSNTSSAWLQGGNTLSAIKKIGTISNHDLPFITNNTEKMRLTATGNLGIGTTTFNATYPERLLVDAGTTGNTNFQNVIVGKGNTNSYAQLNIQNSNAGTGASSDVVATADNGNETTNYVDMGINSSTNTSGVMGGANDAYLYNIGRNFLLGTGTASKSLVFMTGGTTQSTNERMRIDGVGNVAIGTATYNATNPEQLVVDAGTTTSVNAIVGKGTINSYLQLNIQNFSAGTSASSDVVATADNGTETTNYVDMGINSSTNTSGVMGAANDAYLYNIGQNFLLGTGTAAKSLVFMTGGTTQASNERMRITGTGSVGIGTNAPTAALDVSGTYKLGTSGTVLTNMIKTSVAVNDANSFDYTSTEQVTVTVTGATVNANVILNPRSALPMGIGVGWARVSAANTVIIGFTNTDTTPRAIGSVTFDVTIIQ